MVSSMCDIFPIKDPSCFASGHGHMLLHTTDTQACAKIQHMIPSES